MQSAIKTVKLGNNGTVRLRLYILSSYFFYISHDKAVTQITNLIKTISVTDNNPSWSLSVEDLGLLAQIACPCGHSGLLSTNYIRSSWGPRSL